jgi:hypothetical protein
MLNESNDYEQLKKWDIKLEKKFIKGNLQEKKIQRIFADIMEDETKVEVKSELAYSWKQTGNIYIEIAQHRNGRWEDSGLSATTATQWVHVLNGTNENEIVATLVFDTDQLKRRIRYLYDRNLCTISSKLKTDDGNATKAVIVDPRLLLFTDEEILQFKEKIEEEQKERIKKVSKNNSK